MINKLEINYVYIILRGFSEGEERREGKKRERT